MTTSGDDLLYAFRTNLVVTASAGTGKTFRLVTLYTLLTLGLTSKGQSNDRTAAAPVSPSRIAATTFSRAAAAEIRERVDALLSSIARGKADEKTRAYWAILEARAAETGEPSPSSRVMRERAEHALAELPQALIDTLHGLAGRLLRTSALDLGVSPGFGILTDDQVRTSTDAVVDEVLSRALARGLPGATALLDAGGGLSMARRRVAELLDRADEEGVHPGDLGCADFAPVARTWMTELRERCVALVTEGGKAFSEPAHAALQMSAHWLSGSTALPTDRRALEDTLIGAFEPLFAKRSPGKPLPAEEAFVSFRELIKGDTNPDRARRFAGFVAAAPDLSRNVTGIRDLLAEIAEHRWEARRRTGLFGFGDLLRVARDAARDEPLVGARARDLYDVLLVDEFQDTSRVQRDLVYLLRERPDHARSRQKGELPGAQDLERSGLLVVGDRKQSIYGFRGADVTVFTQVCADLAGSEAERALELAPSRDADHEPVAALVTLAENRRSCPAVLEFVNWFAAHDFDATSSHPFDLRYAESERLRPANTDGPRGRVVLLRDDDEIPANASSLVRSASGPMREAIVAAGFIDRLVRDERAGVARFRDVAILARRRSTLPLLEFALARLDVPYFVAGRGLFETREVRDVFALLRLLLDPLDRHALATILRGPALGLTDRSLALLSEPGRGLAGPNLWFREGGPAERLPDDERERLLAFYTRWTAMRRIALGLGPSDAIRYAVETLDFDRVAAALPRPAPRLGNLERLIALAAQRGGSLPSFVRWLERQISDESDEREAAESLPSDDAVTLLTMHASKGLEFPVVLLVDLGAAVRPTPLTIAVSPGAIDAPARLVVRHTRPEGGPVFTPEATEFRQQAVARDTAERRRLTYVAITRAKQELVLVVPKTAPQGSAAATLRRLLPEVTHGERADVFVEEVEPFLLRDAAQAPRAAFATIPLPVFSPLAPTQDGPLGISTTPLATFDECPRRYRLLHELAVEAPRFDGGAGASTVTRERRRALGVAAHRVLEIWPLARFGETTSTTEVFTLLSREAPAELVLTPHGAAPFSRDDVGAHGAAPFSRDDDAVSMAAAVAAFTGSSYARALRDASAAVFREEPFVLPVATSGGALSLRGTIDLLVTYPDGSADVIDYKSSWASDDTDPTFQLRAYALAAHRLHGASPVRVGVMDLRSTRAPTLVTLDAAALREFERHIAALRGRFLLARTSDRFDGVARERCEALACGFLPACHGEPQRS